MVNSQAPAPGKPCRIHVGTCGFSYSSWVEAGFYPLDTPAGRMLPLYARRFSITELNDTWYQMPKNDILERHLDQAPPDFLFSVKLNRLFTHEPPGEDWSTLVHAFRHGIAPLVQAGRLAAVLIELPEDFDRNVTNRRHLARVLDQFDGLPLAVEFRQGSWNNDKVFAEMEKRGVTLVAVDEPDLPGLFPALDVVTNPDLFYVRFHGRNARGWRLGKKQIQYDYNYWEAELREWVASRISSMAERAARGMIFFTNHVRAQAPQNAEIFERLLVEHGLAGH